MSDQPPLSARPQRPAGAPQGPRRKRPAAPPPQSRESRMIGYIVLGFGVVAVVAVLLLAFGGGPDTGRGSGDEATARQIEAELSPITPQTAAPVVPEAPKKELYFNRQPAFDPAAAQGVWQAAIGRYTAILQLEPTGVYQIIYAEPGTARRVYSAGVYTVRDDIFVFTPRLDWPDPSKRGGAAAVYEILTRAPFPMIGALSGGKMVWQNPPQSEKRVLVPYKSPLTAGEDVDYIVWQPLNR